MRSLSILAAILVVASTVVSVGCKPPTETRADVITEENKPVETEMVKAEAGVGKEGQKLKGKEGVMITPIKALFNTKQRIVFEQGVKRALQFYNAAEGHPPKTHDEFMDKIIKFNKIELPELPTGQEYIYDPAKGELMVKRPKQ